MNNEALQLTPARNIRSYLHRIPFRSLLIAFVLASILIMGGIIHSSIAHAGTNGQELQVTCPQASTVSVIGVNQNGQEVTQTFSPDSSGEPTFTTQGYWWVGSVDIIWYGPNGQAAEYYDTVPQQQDDNFYSVNCNNSQNGGANVDPSNCDPNTSPSAAMIVACLGEAPIPPPGGCLNTPCLPQLASGYITSNTNSWYCFLGSYNGTGDAGWLGSVVFTNWDGSTSVLKYVWGLNYVDANGVPIYQMSSGGDEPLILMGSQGITFTCNDPAS